MARISLLIRATCAFLHLTPTTTTEIAASPTAIWPFYSEVFPTSMFTVDNTTLLPVPSLIGIASQNKTSSQIHTHLNFQFPYYISSGQCFCQFSFRITPEVKATSDPIVEVFELDTPTSEMHHPNIKEYQGRLLVKELVPGSGEAWIEFGMLAFDCSALGLGGKMVGYEVAPKWWDEESVMSLTWANGSGLFLRVWGMIGDL